MGYGFISIPIGYNHVMRFSKTDITLTAVDIPLNCLIFIVNSNYHLSAPISLRISGLVFAKFLLGTTIQI